MLFESLPEIARLFPFGFEVNLHRQIQSVGPSLKRILQPEPMAKFSSHFRVLNKPIENIFNFKPSINLNSVDLVHTQTALSLQGLAVSHASGVVFLIRPHFNTEDDYLRFGITPDDFSVDDPFYKYLEVLQHLNKMSAELDHQKELSKQTARLAAIGEMTAGIAHEINNPLAILKGSFVQMQRLISKNDFDVDKILNSLERMDRTCLRISKIIEGLRVFSRDGSRDSFETISVKTLIENTLSFCLERFHSNSVELILDLNEDCTIECQQVQLSQVILNLLNNSHDAVINSPKPWIKISSKVLEDRVQITVSDSGKGIPVEVQEKMMQAFFTTKEIGKGTGLGLSISKRIVEAHEGTLVYDGSRGYTCFVITAPLRQKHCSTAA